MSWASHPTKAIRLDREVGRPSDLKASNYSLPLPCVNSGPHSKSIPTKQIVPGSPLGMKEDTVSSKVVDSKKDDPKCVSCDGQSVLVVGTMDIDPRGINYDSPCVLTVGTMAIDIIVCDTRILTIGTIPIDTNVVDCDIPCGLMVGYQNSCFVEMPMPILPRELCFAKILRSKARDNCLHPGNVIHELLLHDLDAYGNPVEKEQKIKEDILKLQVVTAQEVPLLCPQTQLLLKVKEQFHFLAREKLISSIPKQCQARASSREWLGLRAVDEVILKGLKSLLTRRGRSSPKIQGQKSPRRRKEVDDMVMITSSRLDAGRNISHPMSSI
eukprot:Gb_05716 [translate_table: standard]